MITWPRVIPLFSPVRLAFAITLLGGLLRLFHYNTLSLWFDEGVSLYLARLPWATIFGHIDVYDTHPPGHPAVLKLLTLLLPELTAARLLSVIAGTLTIAVLFFLAHRLLGLRAAVLAGVVLALSPLHIWYSQEARPYAGVALLVGLSYLALVAFHQTLAGRWALIYGLATLGAVYYDYSTLYALAPQVLLFAYLTKVHRRQALPLWGGAVAAGLGFLPWLPKMLTTVSGLGLDRTPALGVTPEKFWLTLLSLVGVSGYEHYFQGSIPTPWEHWSNLQWAFLLGLALVALLGAVALVRHSLLASLVAGGLLLGTLFVGAGVSLYRPGFAERTILAATLGWALLVGAVAVVRMSLLVRLLGMGSVIFLLVLSSLSLDAIYQGAQKDHWRDLAIDTVYIATFGRPIVTYHPGTAVLLDVYAPHLLDRGHINVEEFQDLPPLTQAGSFPHDGVWFIYIELAGIEHIRDQFAQRGYTRLLHNSYSDYSLNPIYMDLYVLPGTHFTTDLPINGSFSGPTTAATGWDLPGTATALQPDNNGQRDLVLTNATPTESRATQLIPAHPQGLYALTFEARSQLQTGRMRSFLLCASATGAWPRIAPDGAGATVPNDGQWHQVSISTMCPAETASVIVDLRNAGQGTTSFRNVSLNEVTFLTQ